MRSNRVSSRPLRSTLVATAWILLASAAASAQEQSAPVQIAGEFFALGLDHALGNGTGLAGLGLRVDLGLTRRVEVESRLIWFPANVAQEFQAQGGRTLQVATGIRGKFFVSRRASFYGLLLPGLLHFTNTVTGVTGNSLVTGGSTHFALDTGLGVEFLSHVAVDRARRSERAAVWRPRRRTGTFGARLQRWVFERYVGRRLLIRFDGGDVVSVFHAMTFTDDGVRASLQPPSPTHSLQMTVGFGWRLGRSIRCVGNLNYGSAMLLNNLSVTLGDAWKPLAFRRNLQEARRAGASWALGAHRFLSASADRARGIPRLQAGSLKFSLSP